MLVQVFLVNGNIYQGFLLHKESMLNVFKARDVCPQQHVRLLTEIQTFAHVIMIFMGKKVDEAMQPNMLTLHQAIT